MKPIKLILIVISFGVSAACSSVKKSTASTTFTAPAPTSTTSPTDLVYLKPVTGIYIPGNDALTAIQKQYTDVTLNKLQEGYTIYTQGACVNCHGAKDIYQLGETDWKNIIEDMAQRANITDEQKDAVYKYVLAIKATQPK